MSTSRLTPKMQQALETLRRADRIEVTTGLRYDPARLIARFPDEYSEEVRKEIPVFEYIDARTTEGLRKRGLVEWTIDIGRGHGPAKLTDKGRA